MPPLALSYEGRDLPDDVLDLVEVVELTPETIAHAGNGRPFLDHDQIDRLRDINARRPLVVHGVSLSIGSADGWNDAYLRLLDQCFAAFPSILWHSEHLGFTRIDGCELCTMLPVPYTRESLDLVAARVEKLLRRYGRPFLLEPVVNLLPPPPGDYSEAAYLNTLVQTTGCGVLLDAYNLVCDARNHCRDIAEDLHELDLEHVRELHIAGGVAVDGVQLDVHTTVPEADTFAVAETILRGSDRNDVLVTFELLREGYELMGDRLYAEVVAIRRWLRDVSRDARIASAVA